MADFKISKGYTVPITGEAKEELFDLVSPAFLGICPTEFAGLKPKLSVAVNDEVQVGSPLFFDKTNPDLQFLSPAAGRVTSINYGPRRVVEEIIISRSDKETSVAFKAYNQSQISGLKRDELITHLMKGGVWPYIRRRPFNKIANRNETPKALFINAMDTAPLASNANFALKDKADAFKAGVAAAKVLCQTVHICSAPGAGPMFSGTEAMNHTFSGTHPAGLVGTHISKIAPINQGDVVWYLNARDLIMLGSFLLTGTYPTERIVALVGPAATKPAYYRSRVGMRMGDIVEKKHADGEVRLISGNVLNGKTRTPNQYLGFYDDQISILKEGRETEFLGWMKPGFNVPSFTRTFVSAFLGRGKKYPMDTNLHGGHRAIIASGMWEEMMGIDVYPEHLIKAALAQDIEAMEQLGILECDPEDFALCTYICPSKTDAGEIIASGLELIEKEG